MTFLITAFVIFLLLFIGERVLFGLARFFSLYVTVPECTAKVYVLFGKVLGVIDEPGLHFPIERFGARAVLVRFFGSVHPIDRALDQTYLRSQPVNTEEGTPMGIGVWYEMRVTAPVDFLFKNSDPAGSLRANVANATVRGLSNMPLSDMLENRHSMSHSVRGEVSPKAKSWGYELGSVYIRKVHFRDDQMIRQIEQKVVNRLTQVTSAIRQAGANQVDLIASAADKEAAVEFARAAAMRPRLVGEAFQKIASDGDVAESLLEALETTKLLESEAELIVIPAGTEGRLLRDLAAGKE